MAPTSFSVNTNNNAPPSRKFVVGIDGSENAYTALQQALSLRMEGDSIEVVYFYNSTQENLPYDLLPDFIKEEYEGYLAKLPASSWSVNVVSIKERGASTAAAFTTYLKSSGANFAVFGFVGRKGPKDSQFPGAGAGVQQPGGQGGRGMPAVRLVGSTAQKMVVSSGASTVSVIVKPWAPVHARNTGCRFVVCVDGSEASHKAFLAAVQLATPRDMLLVLHVADCEVVGAVLEDMRPAKLQQKYNSLLRNMQVRGSFVLLGREHSAGRTGREKIVEYVQQSKATYLFLGAEGLTGFLSGAPVLGSFTHFCLNYAPCSVVTVKNSDTVLRIKELEAAVGGGGGGGAAGPPGGR